MDDQEQSRWQPTRRKVLWTTGTVAAGTVAVLIGYPYGITLWDWIKLLIVPAVIAGGGLWFNQQQQERQREDTRLQREGELEIADRRAQYEALQAYLDQMAQMLTDKERPLHRARPRDSLSKVAQARTLTVLPQLDGMLKARVVQFLSGSGLIRRDTLVFGLTGADLSKASLKHVALTEVSLRMADLRHADLRGTNLQGTDLSYADLRHADLRDAWLRPRLSGRDILRGAYLNYTDLRHADLTGAQVDADYLHRSTSKVQGATMPNGQKYEDWRKDREGRSEDEENSSH